MKTINKPALIYLLYSIITLNYSHAQWVTHGPFGGLVGCLAVKDSFVFAGTQANGLFRSANKGVTWERTVTGLPFFTGVSCLLVDSSTIYAGAGSIYISNDNGNTWSVPANNGLPQYLNYYALKAKGSTLYVGTGKGLYTSKDRGQTWISADSVVLKNFFIEDIVFKGSSIFLATNQGVYVSNNNATTWAPATTGMGTSFVNCLLVKDTLLFAGTSNGKMYCSDNNGNLWIDVSTGIPLGTGYSGQIAHLACIHDSIFATDDGNGLFLSVNNGNSWATVNTGLGNVAYNAILATDSFIYVSTNAGGGYPKPSNAAGVILSTDGGNTWSVRNHGLISTAIMSLLTVGNTIYAGASGTGVFKSTDNGNTWIECSNGLGSNRIIFSLGSNGPNLYAGTHTGMFLSTDSGANWSPINNGYPTSSSGLCITTCDTNLFAGTISNGVMLSKNNGANWQAVNTGITGNYVNSLATIGNHVFAAINSHGLYVTTDNGSNWSSVTVGPNTSSIVTLVARDSVLYAGSYSGGTFMSRNLGVTWTLIDTTRYLTAIGVNDEGIFISTIYRYLYYSPDTGANWYILSNPGVVGGLQAIYSFAANANGVYAGSGAAGVWNKTKASFHTINTTVNAYPTTCTDSSGSAKILVDSNPGATYTYAWSNGSTTDSASQLSAGTYLVTVTSPPLSTTQSVTIAPSNPLNTSAVSSGATCTAQQTGASYQWIDCSNNQAINNANAQSFTASASGSYACILKNGNCMDTTNCVSVIISGIEKTDEFSVNIFPNPTTGLLVLQQNYTGQAQAVITDNVGRVMADYRLSGQAQQLDISKLPAGFYQLAIWGDNKKLTTLKIVKQ